MVTAGYGRRFDRKRAAVASYVFAVIHSFGWWSPHGGTPLGNAPSGFPPSVWPPPGELQIVGPVDPRRLTAHGNARIGYCGAASLGRPAVGPVRATRRDATRRPPGCAGYAAGPRLAAEQNDTGGKHPSSSLPSSGQSQADHVQQRQRRALRRDRTRIGANRCVLPLSDPPSSELTVRRRTERIWTTRGRTIRGWSAPDRVNSDRPLPVGGQAFDTVFHCT
jgi:hypothetical protein